MARRQKRLKRKLSLIRRLKERDPDIIKKLKKLYILAGRQYFGVPEIKQAGLTTVKLRDCDKLGWVDGDDIYFLRKCQLTEKGIHDIMFENYD